MVEVADDYERREKPPFTNRSAFSGRLLLLLLLRGLYRPWPSLENMVEIVLDLGPAQKQGLELCLTPNPNPNLRPPDNFLGTKMT